MQKALARPWKCARCLSRQRKLHRSLATAASAAARPRVEADLYGAGPATTDDSNLRKVFDSRAFWQEFSKSKAGGIHVRRGGLLHNVHLDTPEGFEAFSDTTLEKCRQLVAKILAISTADGYRNIVKDLDRLSDLLCRIIDLSDFVRATHPDPRYQYQAAKAHAVMYEYMNTLNTTTGLNDQLKRALADPEITKSWSVEELKVANILKKDFSQSAIDMPPAKRQRFIELSTKIQDLGSRFVDDMQPARHVLKLDSTRLKGIDPRIAKRLTDRRGNIHLPTVGSAANHILRYAEDEEIRKQVYIASRTAADTQIRVLEQMLQARAELAQLSGFRNYGSMALTDKMAKTPEAVEKFLEALAAQNTQATSRELAAMESLKGTKTGSSGQDTVNAWDRDFYRARLSDLTPAMPRVGDDLSAFFSLGTVMQGLSRLFSCLYGIRFVPAEPALGETWDPEVRRLDVVDEQEGLIGVIYCDLFARPGKSPNPAHFTLRCSRHIRREEINEIRQAFESHDIASTVQSLVNDGMAVSTNSDGSFNQLPVIALICDFPTPSSPSTPPLLPLSQLTTLFHEMGHAMHSVLGRTKLQNVAGTRCATDFAELPSVLMENFATHPEALALYARHWASDEPLPRDKALQLDPFRGPKAAAARARDAADTEVQVRLALLDQAFHSRGTDDGAWGTDAMVRAVDARYALVAEPRETRWQGFFGHLVGYGASYYSYLFDRAIAARVWDVVFAPEVRGQALSPVRREAGERFRGEVLRWGGGRDGWDCVAGVLAEDGAKLEGGGEAAMETVGKWGLGALQH